jgi:hypothetical protein
MSALMDSNPALYFAVMWHSAAFLPRLRELDYKQIQEIAEQANKHSLEFPLHLAGPKDRFHVPLWQEEKLSGAQVMALMSMALWVLCGEKEENCEGLVRAWPIREACTLCTKTT